MAIKDKITRRFSLTEPIMYQGEEYPSADATIYDGNGNETEGTVFADANGQYYTTDSNGNAISVMPVHTLDEVTVTAPKKRRTASDYFGDYLTMSNDATKVLNVPHRDYNTHLTERAIRGAKSHAAWEKEHPNLAAWSYAAGAAPFAVAAYPLAAGLGDAAVSTAAGQTISNGLIGLANAAKNNTFLPWLDAAATSYFGAQGLQDIQNGNFTPETAMDVVPLVQMAKPLYNVVKGGLDITKSLVSNFSKDVRNSMISFPFSKNLGSKQFDIQKASDNYLIENLNKSLPYMPDTEINSLYRNAFNHGDYKTGQAIRDWHFMKNAGRDAISEYGKPTLYYHGAPYGGHSVFDSSLMDATIGGSTAEGLKGNFTTTDLKAALNYSEGTTSHKPLTDSSLDNIIDVTKLRDYGRMRPYEHQTEHMVYPFYGKSKDSVTFDFEGNSWSAYPHPDEFGRKWKLQYTHNFPYAEGNKVNETTETFLDRHSLGKKLEELREDGYDFGTKKYDTIYDKDWKSVGQVATGWRGFREGEYNDALGKWEFYPEIKGIQRVSSRKYKPTTNGIVEQSFDKGKDGVFIKNVQDANPGKNEENWPIDEWVFRDSNQVKLANPFTVDDEGKLIPINKRDDFTNPDIRYQNTTGLDKVGTPWNVEDAQLGSEYTKWFFENDVLPRLMLSRPGLKGTRYTNNSPFIGDFILEKMPTASARGMTTSAIRYDAGGNPFVTSMNVDDMSSLKDKVGALIHESREDMINFHKGLYNSKDQEANEYMEKFYKALEGNDMTTVQEMSPQYYEMQNRLIEANNSSYLTEEEMKAIKDAYKTPVTPLLKDSRNLNEKVSENTRFRSEISRLHGGATGKELDKVIDGMSDEEILDILSSGDSYGQDYRRYVEENPKEQSAMIKNIKNALKLVGIYTGAAITPNRIIRGNGEKFDPSTSRIITQTNHPSD